MAKFKIDGRTLWKLLDVPSGHNWVPAMSWNDADKIPYDAIFLYVRNAGHGNGPRERFLCLFDKFQQPKAVHGALKYMILADLQDVVDVDIIKDRLKLYDSLKIKEVLPVSDMIEMLKYHTKLHDKIFQQLEILRWLYGDEADQAAADAMASAIVGATIKGDKP